MRMVLKILLGLIVLLLVIGGSFVAVIHFGGVPQYDPPRIDLQVELTPERVARGKDLSRMSCNECHLDFEKGRLSGRRMFDVPPVFGVAYSTNITQDPVHGIGSWTDGELIGLLRTGIGRDGHFSMPWMPKLPRMADEDLYSLIAWLRSDDPLLEATPEPNRPQELSFLAKFLSRVAFKPFEWDGAPRVAPSPADPVEFGRYLVHDHLECYSCHSADFKTVDDLDPPASEGYMGGGNRLLSLDGEIILSANITPDHETGIGAWSEEDFVRALREGIRPDGRVLRYPMSRRPEYTVEEAQAMFAYLRTVPALRNPVDRRFHEQGGPALADGRAIYEKYGCITCHGPDGRGLGNLAANLKRFPQDSTLAAWIRNASLFDPHTRMPSYEGRIRESEYEPLVRFVRGFADQAAASHR